MIKLGEGNNDRGVVVGDEAGHPAPWRNTCLVVVVVVVIEL